MREKLETGGGFLGYLKSKDGQGNRLGFNEDLISKILAKGDAEELAGLRLFWQENGRIVSGEEVKLFSYYQRLRWQVHQDCRAALAKRKVERPEKTEEEKNLGCYLEEIEPQVRQAVLSLNHQGFKMQGSGFAAENTQKIYCKDDQFQKLNFPDSFLVELKRQGVVLKADSKNIKISLNRKLSLAEVEAIWLEIEKWVKLRDESLT